MIPRVDAPHFVATKIEAFLGRGKSDFASSRDIEDIVSVLDGRAELIDELTRAPKELRAFVAQTFAEWLALEAFRDALPGHLAGDVDNDGRAAMLEERMRQIIPTA